MKKITCLLLVSLLLISSNALAVSNLSNMTIDELIQLKTQIEAELASRKEVKSFFVPQGIYVADEDFPAGAYRITLDGNPMLPMATLLVKDPSSSDTISDMYSISPSVGTGEIGKVELKEGMIIEVNGSNLLFTVYTGLGF